MDNKELKAELIKWYDRGADDILESLRESIKDTINIIGDQKMSLIDVVDMLDGFITAKALDDAKEAEKNG